MMKIKSKGSIIMKRVTRGENKVQYGTTVGLSSTWGTMDWGQNGIMI